MAMAACAARAETKLRSSGWKAAVSRLSRLIAPTTDPSWTPLFVVSGAVVVDVGAPNSHAMIVSRELGIPCVASVTNATLRIPDGATITVDGAAGTVTIVSLP